MYQNKYEIISKKQIADGIFDFTISCKEVAEAATAGQFVHISVPGCFLRRPISICEIDKQSGTIRLVVQVRGNGTKIMSCLNVGEKMDLLGPLGTGFTKSENADSVILIGGGIGTPPMLELSRCYGERARVITGFRNSSLSILSDDFKKTGARLTECTDDGSRGIKGFVTDALKEEIKKSRPQKVYACGPMVMLKGVAEICKSDNIDCEISLEERMACGVGACLGCAVKLNRDGNEFYGHVCKDGPVFSAKEVVF
ncbi:MAG: dihydroorotate dehydrogenase electron transfer subunit [Ruminococcus sp.]|nr:dihydroorotate dehydrogenase electron transfer subunit [Ruminococcus sp.]